MFSQGKASQIINEVFKKNIEYIILKNNQPTAVLVSVEEYKKQQDEIASLKKRLEEIDETRLLTLAAMRKGQPMTAFEDLIAEEGMTLEEIRTLSESVEIE
jgi:prevent-host-death family protein